MRKIYFDLNIEEWNFKKDYEDIYFLLHCLYNAKTELYDRTLTDMRSRYDPTEAFIDGWNRSRSNWYSKKLYDKCVKCIELKTRSHWNNNKRRRHGLPVLRGIVNKCRLKEYPGFHPSVRFFCMMEDLFDEILITTMEDNLNSFVEVKDLAVGDANVFRVSE